MKLLFVYNANGGKVNAAFDMVHKLLSPSTYACSLCALTHGVFSEKEAWRAFREESKLELEFLHKDEFEALGHATVDYPVILQDSEGMTVLVDSARLNDLPDVEALISLLQTIE